MLKRVERVQIQIVLQSRVLILLCIAASLFSVTASAQTLQRLFSTPEQRAELDRLRAREAGPDSLGDNTAILAIQDTQTAASSYEDINKEVKLIALSGSVLSSDGSYTIWINGQPYNQFDLPQHMQLLEPFQQGQLQIYDPATMRSHNLKPGQTLDLVSGRIVESFDTQQAENLVHDLVLDDATVATPGISQVTDGEQDDRNS